MPADSPTPPSFATHRRWSIGFNRAVGVIALAAIVVLVNFASRNYFFHRAFVSSQTRVQLAPQTLSLLKSLTNDVRITLYYDKDEPMFTTISALLNEYRLANPRLTVETVDYNRNPAEAQKIKLRYNLNAPTDKDLVIFDCAGRVKTVPGAALTEYTLEALPSEREREFRKKPVAFKGELMFSSVLLAVNSPEPLRACYLTGHGEHKVDSAEDQAGFQKFISLLLQNYIRVEPLSLLGTNAIPADCRLLVIAAPTTTLPELELNKISRYLDEGGRALVLLNCMSVDRETGLEALLEKWDVRVSRQIIKDEPNSIRGQDVVISRFSTHPVVNPLLESRIHLVLPRWVSRLDATNSAADAPKVDELAFTSDASLLTTGTNGPGPRPVAVAVEKGAVKGVANERGTTRLVVVGDSLFLGNQMIDSAGNRDFGNYAVNWLVDRTALLQGLGPKPVAEFKLVLTQRQMNVAQGLLLAGLPGAVLFVGLLVWLRRRN